MAKNLMGRRVVAVLLALAVSMASGVAFFTTGALHVFHVVLWAGLVPLIVAIGFLHGVDKTSGVIPFSFLLYGTCVSVYAVTGLHTVSSSLYVPLFLEALFFALHVTSIYLAVYLYTSRLDFKFEETGVARGFDKIIRVARDMSWKKDDVRERRVENPL